MKKNSLWVAAASVVLLATSAIFAEGVKLDGIKCPVSGKPASADHAVDFKGGKVYLCCPGCTGKVEANAAKCNHQLVATGQFKQVKCPLTGRAVNEEVSCDVGGVKVGLCCMGCKGKTDKLEGDKLVEACFADAAFAKGFAIVPKP